MRRKGEQKLERQWMPWGPGHPVVRMMASGDSWFRAWQGQAGVVWPVIARRCGIPMERMHELDRGGQPTEAEVQALAALWNCPVADIWASIDGAIIREK